MDPAIRNILSVIAGIAALFICGLVLYPLVQIIFDKYFQVYLGPSQPKDAYEKDLVVLATVILWVLVSSTTGGFVCSLIAITNEWLFISICIALLLLTFLILSRGQIIYSIESMISMLMIPAGFIIGRGIAMAIKARRQRKKLLEIDFENKTNDIE